MTAPWGSVIVPRNEVVAFCAKDKQDQNNVSTDAMSRRDRVMMTVPP
jgi:hypothetical protein